MALVKIGANGSGQWLYRYETSTCLYPQTLSATDDGGAIVYASTGAVGTPALAVIFRVGSDGSVVWSHVLRNADNLRTASSYPGQSLTRIGADDWLAVSYPGVVRFNGAGQFVSEQLTYSSTIANQVIALDITGVGPAPGGYLISSFGDAGNILARILNGGIAWANENFTFFPSSIQGNPDGTATAVASRPGFEFVRRFDDGGFLLWTNTFSNGGFGRIAAQAIDPLNGDVVWWTLSGPAGQVLHRIDEDGAVTSKRVSVPSLNFRMETPLVTARGVYATGWDPVTSTPMLVRYDAADQGCLVEAPEPPDIAVPFTEPQAQPVALSMTAGTVTAEPIVITSTCLPMSVENLCAQTQTIGRAPVAHSTAACDAARLDFEFKQPQPQKVLLHKYRTEDDYPSVHQQRVGLIPGIPSPDRHIQVEVLVSAQGQPLSGRNVYFRVTDPPDDAPYTVAAGVAQANDNRDPSLPKGELLVFEPCSNPAPGSPICAVSQADGFARVILKTSEHIAGENYHVEASLDASFSCAPACERSGMITTWKRAYLENDSMFRAGSYVASRVNSGDTQIEVTDIRPFLGHEGERIAVIHADPILAPPPIRRHYMEEHLIGSIIRNQNDHGGRIGLPQGEAVLHAYDSAEILNGVRFPHLADAVGLVTGNQPIFFADPVYVNDLFNGAFVEYVGLQEGVTNSVPYLPYQERLEPARQSNIRTEQQVAFAQKWFEHRGSPSHHYLGGAARERNRNGTPTFARGRSLAASSLVQSLVFVADTEGIFQSALNRRFIAEIVTHELAHLWNTNPKPALLSQHDGPNGISDFRQWNAAGSTPKWCQMRHSYTCGMNTTCPEYHDGQVAFHYEKQQPAGVDSEYLWIRERCEPVPAERTLVLNWWLTAPAPCR